MTGRVVVSRCAVIALVVVGAVAGVLGLPQPAGANVTGISITVSSGGSCSDVRTPSGYDDAFECDMTEGTSLVIVGRANSNRNSLTLSWSSTGGISDSESQGRLMSETLFGVTTYWRENTGTLSCTRDGTATLTAKDASDTDKIKLTISCEDQPAVSISDWNGDSRTGAGKMTDDFEVSPSNASCSASRSGISASVSITDNRGTDRSVSVTTTGTGTVTVTLTCTRSGYRSATASADFEARKPRVSISGFNGASRDNAGEMTDSFTVSPSSATCTAERDSGIAATVSISGAGTSTRTVTVDTGDKTGTVTVEVNCTRSGHTADSDTADFTANAVVVITGFRGDRRDGPGEVSDSFTVSPDDATCTATRESGIQADVEISGTGSTRTVTVDTEGRTGSVTVEARCTKSGFRTATDTGTFTARPEVLISGLSGRTRTGAGTMTDAFTVSPSNASCTASRSSGISATVSLTDNSGSSRTVSVTTTGTGSVDVRVRCTRSGHASDSQTVTFTANRPRVSISGFGGASRNGPGEMTDHFTVSPTSASCSAQHESGISVELEFTDDTSGSRALKVTTTGTGEASVKVTCTATGHTSASDTATFTARPLVTISGFDGATRTGAGAMTDDFTVSPSNASCTASRSSGISATVTLSDNSGSSRTVSVTTTGTGTVRVRVSCTRTGHVTAADTENFTAEEITLDSVGLVVTSGGKCDTDSTPPTGFDGAWDCEMGKGRELVAEVTASGPDSGLSLAWSAATGGVSVSATQGTVQVSVVGTITTYSRTSTATFECSADGSATVKTSVDGTVAHTGRVGIDCQPVVPIANLDGAVGIVGGTLLDDFTVSPASATCTTAVSGIAATATFSDSSGTSRELSVTASVPGTATVKVMCDATGYAPTTVTASYTFNPDVDSVEVKATSGGGCSAASSTPAGVDDAWNCWMGKGRSLTVVATATDSSAGMSLSWPSGDRTGDVTLTENEGDETFNEITGKYQRSNTATFACTDHGSARVVTTLNGAQAHVGLVSIDCRDVVTITDLSDASETRPRGESGAVSVSDDFTVSPSWAECSVVKDSGVNAVLSFPDDSGTSRTVAASISVASGTVSVKVTCSALSAAKNYAPTTEEADLTLDPTVSVEDVSVRATSGGGCGAAAAALPEGVDDGWDCWMGIGRSLTVVATAEHSSAGMSLSWPSGDRTSGVSLTEDEGDESFGELTLKYQRSNTATFACTEDGSARVVTTLGGKEAHVGLVNIDCRPIVEITGLDDASKTRPRGVSGAVLVSEPFTVSPGRAECSVAKESGVNAVLSFPDDSGTSRTVAASISVASGTVTVEVTCSVGDEYAPTTVEVDLTLDPTVSVEDVSVRATSGGGCGAAATALPEGVDDGWDCWMGIGRSLTVVATAEHSSAGMSLSWPSGDRTSGVSLTEDEGDEFFGELTLKYQRSNRATFACTDDGSARVVTTLGGKEAHVGLVNIDCRPLVTITNLDGGAGIVGDTVPDDFDVSPASATCTSTPSPSSATATFSDDSGTERELSVTGSAIGTATVEVTCEATGYAPTTVEASYAFSADVSSVELKVTSGEECPVASPTPAGFDDAWACEMGRGRQLVAEVKASSSDNRLSIAWPATTGGVSVDASSGQVESSSFEGMTTHSLTSTATIECTDDGSATVKSSVGNVVAHSGQLGVTCLPVVEMSGLDGADGPKGKAVPDDFKVVPSSATCTTAVSELAATAAVSASSAQGSTHRVSVTGQAVGTATVAVTCEATGYAPTTEEADFVIVQDLSSVELSVTSGGACPTASSTPAGFDDAWACWMGEGRELIVEVKASSSDSGLGIAWPSTTGGVSVDASLGKIQINTDFEMPSYSLISTATIECTDDGSATVKSSVDNVVAHTGHLGVTCRPVVEITDLDDASKTRRRGDSEPVLVSEDFTVSPARAECSVASDSDVDAVLSFPDDTDASRTVGARISDESGTVTVEVTCSVEDEYAPTTAEADLTLNAAVSVEDVSVYATSGGGCEPAGESAMLPDGVDEGWDCWMGIGRELKVVAAAKDPSDGLSLSWPADARTSGVSLTALEGAEVFSEETGKHQRSSTATFACTDDGSARVVTTLDGAEAHVGQVSVECRDLVTITEFDGAADSARTITDDIKVTPSWATCTPVTSGLAANATVSASPVQGFSHRVSVEVTGAATGTVTVEVTCSAERPTKKYAPTSATAEFVRFGKCTEDLGVLGHGTVTRSGTIAVDADCRSWKRGTVSSPNYARRYTFRVPAASRVSVDAASAAVDTYLYVLHGNGAAAELLGSDDDGRTAGGTDSRVADVRVLPGLTYVAEVTTDAARKTGGFTLTVTTQPDLPAVEIIGFDPVTRIRNGTHVLSDPFTVEPATARCTATAPASVIAGTGGNHTASQLMTGPAEATVEVICSNDGNSDGTARAQFSLWQAISSVTAKALGGGSCAESTDSLPTGVDARYACTVAKSVTLNVSAMSRGAHATPVIGWSADADADVTVAEATAGTPTAVDYATTPIDYTRTGTANITCTADGTVTVTVTAGADTYTVQLDITCGPHPAAHCVDAIGELGEGITTRTGTITRDAACTSIRRKPGDRRTWYAKRHTFNLDAPATVTFVLEGVPAARPSVNVALLVLDGAEVDGSGARLYFNNNDSSNQAANRLNSRLANIALPKGSYTVEATTWHPRATGRYTLTIIAPAVRDSVAVTTLSGGSCEASDDDAPAGVDDLWDCTVQPEGRLRVLATARSGATSFSHAWTAADGVTIPDEPGNPKVLARQAPDELDTAYRQSSRVTLACTTDGAADLDVRFGTGSGSRTRKVRLDIDCNTPVQINGLADATAYSDAGTTVSVQAPFTVEPATAECTAAAPAGTPTVTNPGGVAAKRVVSMSLAVESSAEVTVTCTATGRPDGVAKTSLKAHKPFTVTVWGDACAAVPASIPRSYRCALSDEHRVTLGAAADAEVSDIRLSWTASGGATVSLPRQNALSQLQGPDGAAAGWRRTGSVVARCTSDGTVTLTATAGTGTDKVTRTAPVSIDCQDQGRISGLADVAGAGTGTVTVADTFTVTPADAPCRVTSTAGTATVDTVLGGAAGDRKVSVALAVARGADASARVTVDCTPPGHAPVVARATFTAAWRDSCDDPLGVLRDGDVTRTGVITEDATCTSAQRGGVSGGWNQYARRHTFTLDRPADVQIWMNSSATNSDPLDTYVLLLYGHGTDGRVHSRNDNDSSRPRTTNSRLSRETFGPGKYTIEATTSLAGHTGYYDLRVNTRLGVLVSGLEDTTVYGTGTIAVADTFTVDPPNAPCTTTAGTITPATGAERTLTLNLEAGASSNVTVRCDVVLRPEGVATARFAAREAVDSLTVRAVEGGHCERASTTPSDVDAAYECTMAPGRPFVVAADASSPQNSLTVAWSASGGVTVASQDPGVVSPSLGFGAPITTWHRTATATLNCTRAGTATALASLPGAGSRTARLSVSCRNAVRITGLAGQSRTGTGTVQVTDTFTVAPARAVCTSTSGTVTAGAGRTRTLSVPLTAPATREVTVTCTAANRAQTTQTVTFSIVEPCADHLGTLRPGAVTRSGTIARDSSCTSVRRKDNPGDDVFYARRHTFRLTQPARVTIELESATSNDTPLNTYLVLLDGHSTDGTATALHSNDDVGPGHGTLHTNSRLTGLDLAAGSYTIEATTHAASATGNYDLAVSAVTVSGIGTSTHTVAGKDTTVAFGYEPTDAKLTITAKNNVTTTLSYGGGLGTLIVNAPTPGAYTAKLNIAVPQTSTANALARGADAADERAAAAAYHTPVEHDIGGTVCLTAVVLGQAVCAADSGYRVTIRTPATTSRPARAVPAACISRLLLGRWHIDTEAWPSSGTCDAAVNNVTVDNVVHNIRRRTRFYTFEIAHTEADVTVRLSSNDRNVHLALWRASTDPIDTGLLHADLGITPVAVNNDVKDGFGYLDGKDTDSRIQTILTKGVYVISVASLTTPDSQDRYTVNVKAIQTSS